MKKVLLVFVLLLAIVFSCTDRDDNVDMVNIRIKNNTDFSFTEVRVVAKDTAYENIAPGDFSEYIAYEQAFEEMALTVQSDSTSFNYTPSVTTDSLPIGLYTYELAIGEGNEIDFTFKIDY